MKNERIKSDKTELLYETDGMITEFEAVVTEYLHDSDSDRDYVILDRTAFFPEVEQGTVLRSIHSSVGRASAC